VWFYEVPMLSMLVGQQSYSPALDKTRLASKRRIGAWLEKCSSSPSGGKI